LNAVLRHAAAAEVLALVRDAFASGNYASVKHLLAAQKHTICLLN